jgi:UDP-2,3-diacylglucosamine hydrolase
MRISAISDVHVKKTFDDADRLLTAFLKHPEVTASDYIVLLGDIFDLMCGPHQAYLRAFHHLFDLMDDLQKRGKKVLYFEGNHDVHLEKLFRYRWPNGEVTPSQVPLVTSINGKSYYFSHGDEHEVDNISYQRYKNLIISPPLRFVANNIMPYQLLNFLGERASKMSRKRGTKTYNEDLVRERFRQGVMSTTSGQYDFVLGGHSHVQDAYALSPSGLYLNNGFALRTKTFIMIDDHKHSFPSLV